jgi:DNA-binding transcriptional regulator GbsR (MarR family)
MTDDLARMKHDFIEALGRISSFWGFGKMTGQLYGLLYLSPKPLTLDEMKDQLGVSKGNVCVNIRNLESLGMARKLWIRGDRRDYYEAETDFWKMIKTTLREREQKEFDRGLQTLAACLSVVSEESAGEEADFYRQRLTHIRDFFTTAYRVINAILALEELEAQTLGMIGLLEDQGGEEIRKLGN